MKPSFITNIHFNNQSDLDDLLSSNEFTAEEIRQDLLARLSRSEGIVVIVSGSAPRALILKSSLHPELKGTPDGNSFVILPFA